MKEFLVRSLPNIFRLGAGGVLALTNRGILYGVLLAIGLVGAGGYKIKSEWDKYQEKKAVKKEVRVERQAGEMIADGVAAKNKREILDLKRQIELLEAEKCNIDPALVR